MTMKAPRYAALGVQEMIDAGINGFAMQLMAESHADNPDKFKDETVMLMAKAHNGTPVYMLISTQAPDLDQFKGWPAHG
jgi:hypothetical protein